MKIIKKICLFLLVCLVGFQINFQYTQGFLDFPRSHNGQWSQGEDRPSDPTVSGIDVSDDNPIGQGTTEMGDKSVGILHLPQPDTYETKLGYTLALIQIAVNWILGMLAVVSLVYILYCGFLVLSSGSEDKNASKGKSGIKNAAIAIAGIGLSWLIISAMIWFINTMA